MEPTRPKPTRNRTALLALYTVAAIEIVWLAGLLRFTSEMHGQASADGAIRHATAEPSQDQRSKPEGVDAAGIYGPPSPPKPVYGPPTPPSRVPLLSRDIQPPGPGVMQVDAALTKPVGDSDGAILAAIGWKSLGLTRGIPFAVSDSPPATRPDLAAAEPPASDGRRRLFSQAAPEPAPIGVAYCIDLGIGSESVGRLGAVRKALRTALGSLRPKDSFWVLVLQDGGRPLDAEPTTASDDNVRKTGAALESLGPEPPGPLAAALKRAAAAKGVGWIVVIAAGSGSLEAPDSDALRQTGAQASASGVRVIALVTGDGRSTERAGALRDLAVQTRGAFAWLRPGE